VPAVPLAERNEMIEKKVTYGAGAGAVAGLVVWALMSFVPAFHTGVPEPVVAFIPVALAWAGHVTAAWLAPHTHRTPQP
jgi:Kef-type K+ transport system membrane component KefB